MERYVDIAILIIYSLITAISLICSFVYAKKEKDKQKLIDLTNATQKEVFDAACELIENAETFKNYSGAEKLNWVVTRMKEMNQNLYNESGLIELINGIVAMTKKVNVSSQKKKI